MNKKLLLALISSLVLLSSIGYSLETALEVPETNFPPIQIQNIPDRSWPMNKNLTNTFDLDDYFIDYEDIITYNVTSAQNITIVINSTTNEVSFYSDLNFTGYRNVTFTASDGFAWVTSNIVFLNVTNDLIPPQWSNLSMAPSTVNQNTVVTFYANWTDNVQLSEFILSINQGGGWTNYSQNFSGIQNTSSYQLQITAAGGTNVLWLFYAYDTSGNLNFTTTEHFTVETPEVPDNDDDDDSSSGGSRTTARGTKGPVPITSRPQSPLKGFDVIPDNLVVELKQGESITKLIKVQNLGLRETNFTLTLKSLGDLAVISENNLSIKSGRDAVVAILFKTNRKSIPDIYFGRLTVATLIETMHIPVVLTINPFVVNFETKVEIPKEFKTVSPGKSVEANIKVINKADVPQENITIQYAVMDFFGEVIASNQEEVNFSEQTIFLTKNFTIPLDVEQGRYIFYARAYKDDKVSIDIDEFTVGKEFNLFSFFISNIIYIIIGLVFIITLLLFVYYHRTKEKERLLNLYIMINELKKLLDENRIDEAALQYNKIKLSYHEKIGLSQGENKEDLKEEMRNLVKEFNAQAGVVEIKNEAKKENNEAAGKTQEKNEPEIKEEAKEDTPKGESEAQENKENTKEKIQKVKEKKKLKKDKKVNEKKEKKRKSGKSK